MDEASLKSRKRAAPGISAAIEAATARIVSAAKGDLLTPAPLVVKRELPGLATALEDLLTDMSGKLDSVSTLALFDPVTSLPNRMHFRREAEERLRALPLHGQAALFFIDLDNFKAVNDSYGHAQGDQLLCLIANRLRAVASYEAGEPIVGRLAGDEFTLLVSAIGGAGEAARIGAALLAAMIKPCNVAGHSVEIGASIGIALSADVGCALTDMMRAADVAMYRAKSGGRQRFEFYNDALAEALAERTQLDSDLRASVGRGELALMVQPQVALANGAVIVAEALLRWNHSVDGLRMPHQFLAAAEESGIIFDISDWAIREATKIARDWHCQNVPVRLAINLGARQLNQANFFPRFRDLAGQRGVPMGMFEIEVTEEDMAQCGDAVIRELSALRGAGAIITVDTAGIGLSSIAQLRKLPVDRLKIHRSLIAELNLEPSARAVVQALVALGHALGFEVVAAGVETDEQLAMLRIMGCNAAQGYIIERPLSIEAFTAWQAAPNTRSSTPA